MVGLGLLALVALTEIIAHRAWLLGDCRGFRDEPLTMALAESYTRLALPFLALTTLASLVAAFSTRMAASRGGGGPRLRSIW